jgi:hypothetical protein
MIVVSDTSPLLSLALIGQLDLLHQLYGSIVIPPAVHDEIVVGGAAYRGGEDVARQDWIHIDRPTNAIIIALLMRELDRGEAEAIALAIESKADLLLLDEYRARRMADYLSLPHTGLIDILGEAKRQQYLTAIKPALDDLIARAHFHLSRKLYHRTLESAGEIDHANPA